MIDLWCPFMLLTILLATLKVNDWLIVATHEIMRKELNSKFILLMLLILFNKMFKKYWCQTRFTQNPACLLTFTERGDVSYPHFIPSWRHQSLDLLSPQNYSGLKILGNCGKSTADGWDIKRICHSGSERQQKSLSCSKLDLFLPEAILIQQRKKTKDVKNNYLTSSHLLSGSESENLSVQVSVLMARVGEMKPMLSS